jgi:hypothetical protein
MCYTHAHTRSQTRREGGMAGVRKREREGVVVVVVF